MSLRWSSYFAPKPPKGAQKRETAVFRLKSHFAWRKSATKFLCVKTVSDCVCKASIGLTNRAKIFLERPLLPEILGQTDRIGAKSPIFGQFSLVAPQPWHLAKKSSINTNRKSTTRFPMSPRWTSYVVPSPPSKRWLKNAKCPKFEQ